MHQFLYSDLSAMKKQMEEEIRAQLEANMSNMMSWDEKGRNEKQGNSHSLTKISVRSLTKPVANFLSFQSATLTLPNPSQPFQKVIKIKINLKFYFRTSLWCPKRFYEVLKGLHKTFWGTTKKCENNNLS